MDTEAPLYDFQAEDLPFFLSHPRSLILYEPRLGKTVETCHILALDPDTSSVLIACSKNAMGTWMDHLAPWFDKLCPEKSYDIRIIRGKNSTAATERKAIWAKPRTAKITVYIVTFNAFLNDYKWLNENHLDRFDTVIGDEVHTKLKNRKTQSSEIFRKITKTCRRFHPLSGTLAGKWGPADYWSVLNMCSPKEFGSYWQFAGMFCDMIEGQFGWEIIGVKNAANWHHLLSRWAKIRLREVVRPQMPKVQRGLKWVEPTAQQQKMYDLLGKDSFIVTENGALIVSSTSLETAIRKRQILACPQMLDEKLGVGAAMEDVIEGLTDAKENDDVDGQHIVIFSAFRRALPFFEAALRGAGYSNIEQLYGGLEPEDLKLRIERFSQSRGIILCTTKFAQAFSLSTARVCYHIGYEYDPNDNKQAEDRLVPQSGDYNISSNYYAYRNTDDDSLAEMITMKHRIITQTVTKPGA